MAEGFPVATLTARYGFVVSHLQLSMFLNARGPLTDNMCPVPESFPEFRWKQKIACEFGSCRRRKEKAHSRAPRLDINRE